METHEKKLLAARTALVLDEPFFGVLALRLRMVADPSCATTWVDGRTLGYNPEFVDSRSHAALTAALAHEVMHCACGHPWRRDSRDQGRWNEACDLAVNPILQDAGFALPEGCRLDPAHQGKAAEWIYDRMPRPQEGDDDEPAPQTPQDAPGEGQGGGGSEGDGQGDPRGEPSEASDGAGQGDPAPGQPEPSPQGEVRDAPADAAADGSTEADWSSAVQQAANAAASQGKLPGGLERFAAEAARPTIDWRSALRRFVQEVSRADYSWRRPNPRYLAGGIYLPALHAEEMGPMAIAVDTSGSIDEVLLAQFFAEMQAIVDEAKPARVHVIYCDAKVQRVDTFERDEPLEMSPAGGGGTRFAPVFEAVEELDEPPACLVYLTDLLGSFPEREPEVPTLWATTRRGRAPFGEVLEVA